MPNAVYKPFYCLNCNRSFNRFGSRVKKSAHYEQCVGISQNESDQSYSNHIEDLSDGSDNDQWESPEYNFDDDIVMHDSLNEEVLVDERRHDNEDEEMIEGATSTRSSTTYRYSCTAGDGSRISPNFGDDHDLAESQSITGETCDGEPSSVASDSMSTQQAIVSEDTSPIEIRFDLQNDQQCPNNITTSQKLHTLLKKGGLSRDNYDKSIGIINEYLARIPEEYRPEPLLTEYRLSTHSVKRFPIKVKTFHMCPNGCRMYNDEIAEMCSDCNASRYQTESTGSSRVSENIPAKVVKQLSVLEQLALLVYDKPTRELLRYRVNRTTKDGVMMDVFDGKVYRKATSRFFPNDLDLAIGIYTDGFTKYKSMTIVHFVIMNFPPSVRTEQKYMLQSCIIPGPQAPKDLMSFLKPTIDEFKALASRGMNVLTDVGGQVHVRGHLLFAGGDIPAVAKMCGHAGHMHQFGCRTCFVDKHDVPTRNYEPRPQAAAYRKREHYRSQELSMVGQAPTDIAFLENFHGPSFFPLDQMHLLGHGIGKQMISLLLGSDYSVEGSQCPLKLSTDHLRLADALLEKSSRNLPSSFSSKCRNLSKQGKFFRAIDYLHFMRFAVPTIIADIIPTAHRQALLAISNLIQRASSRSITKSDIEEISLALVIWHTWLQDRVNEGSVSGKIFTITEHYLTHIPYMIERMGPLAYYSAFAMERAVGAIKERIKSRKLPGQNAANILVVLAAERREERLGVDDFSAHDSDSEFAEEDPEELKRTSKPKRTITEDDGLDSPELWAPFQRKTFAKLADECGFDVAEKTRIYYRVFEKKRVAINLEEHVWTAN